MDDQSIHVRVPDGDMIVGYIAMFKVIGRKGEAYWAQRMSGLNDMEALGMAVDMANSCQADIGRSKTVVEDE